MNDDGGVQQNAHVGSATNTAAAAMTATSSSSREKTTNGSVSLPASTSATTKSGGEEKTNKAPSKGFSHVVPARKIVETLIKRSRLEITSLHISKPDGSSMCAKGKIRLTHLGNGPVPLVGLRIKFKDPKGASLHWTPVAGTHDPSTKDRFVVQILIEPITMQPSASGSVSSEVDMRFMFHDETLPSFIEFVRHIIRSDAKEGTRILMKAVGVEVKAFGLRFGDLKLEKDVVLGGLGCLGGVLLFDDEISVKETAQSSVKSGGNEAAESEKQGSQRKKRFTLGRKSTSKSRLKIDALKERFGVSSSASNDVRPVTKQLDIGNLDIIGGDATRGIQVASTVTIENPAREPELIIEPGDLRFALCVEDIGAQEGNISAAPPSNDNWDLPPGLIRVGMIQLAVPILRPGMNTLKASGFLVLPPAPTSEKDSVPSSPTMRAYLSGQRLLASIMQDEGVSLSAVAPRNDDVSASSAVSDVGWLAAAFRGTRINARIPPLGERVRLLDGAEVRVEGNEGNEHGDLPSPGSRPSDLQSSVARATLRNGFGADIHVYELNVSAQSEPLVGDDGRMEVLELGKVFSPRGYWDGLTLRRGQPAHVSLPMEINPDPRVLIEILRKSARSRKIDLGNPLSELLEELRFAHWNEAGFAEPPKSRPSSSRGTNSRRTSLAPSTEGGRPSTSSAAQPSDDLAALLSNALANMRVTAHIEATASIGNYALPGKLKFKQRNLPIALSTATAAALLPLVGKPFVKAMVDRAEIEVQAVKVLRMDDRGIQAHLTMQLVNFGPLSAEATFDEGVHLRDANGMTLAIIYIDGPLGVTAGSYEPVTTEARIVPAPSPNATDVFSSFVGQLLSSNQVTFNALADPISITSGGVHFRASLEKDISVTGLGGFRGLRMNDLQILGEASAPAAGVSFSVAAPANASQPSAITFSTNAQIENQGDIYLSLSKLEVAIAVDDVQIGQASIDDLELTPGKTAHVRVKGVLYAPPARQADAHKVAVEKMSTLISDLLSGKEATVQVLGRRAWVATEKKGSRPVSLAWLDSALRTFSTEAGIQWQGGVQVVSGIDVGKVEATFAARKPLQLRIEEVMAQYSVPFPVQFDLQSIDATMDIMFAGKVIANCHASQDTIEHVERSKSERRSSATSLHPQYAQSNRTSPRPTPSSPGSAPNLERRRGSVATTGSNGSRMERYPSTSSANNSSVDQSYHRSRNGSSPPPAQQPQTGKVKLSLKQFELKTDEDDLLGDMISHVVEAGPEGTERITLRGVAHATVKTAVGLLTITVPLGVDHKLDLSGLDGLRSSPLHYTDLDIVSANPKYISVTLNINSHNPSQAMTILVPDSSLSLGAYFKDEFVGDVIVGGQGKGIEIAPGPVRLDGVEFRYRPSSSSEISASAMLSKLFCGESVELCIRGHRRSSVNSALSQALRIVSVPIEINPLGRNDILERIRVQLGMGVITSNTIDAKYLLNNPINLPIDVLHLDVKAYYRSMPFGTASKTFSKEGVCIGRVLPDSSTQDDANGSGGGGDGGTQPASSGEKSKRSSMSTPHGGDSKLQRLLLQPGVRRFEGDLVVKLQQPPDQLVKAFLAERGSIVLDVDLTIHLDIQGYSIPRFAYRQKVPLQVSGLNGVARLLRLV